MKMYALNEIAEVIAGQSPSSRYYNDKGEGLPFYQGKADFGELHPSPQKWCTKPKKIAEKDDILISVRAPVGPTNLANERCCIGRGLSAIRPSNELDTKYLLHYLRYIEPKLSGQGRGSTFSAITQKELRAVEIPLPPLAEQRRIAAVLDKAATLRSQRQQAIAKLDTLLQAVFLDMFGDPVTNPKAWEVCATIDICDGCIVPGRDKPKSFTGDIPWITTNDLNYLGITSESKKQIGLARSEIKEVRARLIPKGSVVITCVGDLGVTSVVGCDFVMNQQLHAFLCNDRINNRFLAYSLSYQTPYMYKRSTSTTVPYMNKTVCNNIPTIVPPIALQLKFDRYVQAVEQVKQKLEDNWLKFDNLFFSLQQRAFRGEL